MTLRMEHAPAVSTEDGDEDGRLCSICTSQPLACCLQSPGHSQLNVCTWPQARPTAGCRTSRALATRRRRHRCATRTSSANATCVPTPLPQSSASSPRTTDHGWDCCRQMSRRILFFRHSLSELEASPTPPKTALLRESERLLLPAGYGQAVHRRCGRGKEAQRRGRRRRRRGWWRGCDGEFWVNKWPIPCEHRSLGTRRNSPVLLLNP